VNTLKKECDWMQDKDSIIRMLRAQIKVNGHIIGVAAGAGITAKYTVMGGADFILALSAGKFRQMGRSSLASYLCYSNSNEVVMEFATRELLPIIQKTPILFGLNANDPTVHLYEYIAEIKKRGFAGINNFPSVGMMDGQFLEALEEEGVSYDVEVEAMRFANYMGLFTVAFVFNEEQAEKMARVGADVICAHLGLTTGGMLGAKNVFSLEHAKLLTDKVFKVCDAISPDFIKMIYGGPASTPFDMHFMYNNTACMGYIGGSSFERIPVENAILNTTRAFKNFGSFDQNDIMVKILNRSSKNYDYVKFVKNYIAKNYMKEIRLSDLALVAHISSSYLSTIIKKELGYSFSEYLVRFRIDKAAEIIKQEKLTLQEVAQIVGYSDYAQFSKMFKKYKKVAPKEFAKSNIDT
jgi:predicted TIM-barrel enzyme/AraC-like DNA-binding protein